MRIPVSVIKSGVYDCEDIYLAQYLKHFVPNGADRAITCIDWLVKDIVLSPYRGGTADILKTFLKMRDVNNISISGRLDGEDTDRLEIVLSSPILFDEGGECAVSIHFFATKKEILWFLAQYTTGC